MFNLLAGHGKSAGCLLSGQTPKLICGKYARGLVLNLRTQVSCTRTESARFSNEVDHQMLRPDIMP